MAYFIDASGMLQIARGNPNYERFLSEELTTSLPCLHELHSLLLKETDKATAEMVFSKFRSLAADFDDSVLMKASHMKHESEAQMSHADSIGLAIAMEKDIKLLTSNENLKSLPAVHFVD